MVKTRHTFVKIAKITAKTRHQITTQRPLAVHYTVYKSQHLALTTIITCSAGSCSARFSNAYSR